jgi:denticleless
MNTDEHKVITSGSADGMIKLWDVRTKPQEIESTLFINTNGKRHGITDMKIDHSGTRLFSCCMDNSVYVHNLNNLKKPALRFQDPDYVVGSFNTRISISPDDRFLLSGSYDKKVFAWEVDHPKAKPHVFEGHTDKVTSVCWSKASMDQVSHKC